MSKEIKVVITPNNVINTQILSGTTINTQITGGARGKDGLAISINNLVHTNGNIDIDGDDILVDKYNSDSLTLNREIERIEALIINDKTYIHSQILASKLWMVHHDLSKFPSVSVVDSGGNIVFGSITYISKDTISIEFTAEFSGTVYLN